MDFHNATGVDIEPGVGKVALSGATSVTPRESTTYTLTAIGPGGSRPPPLTYAVTHSAPPPPRPVVQPVVGNLPGFPVPGASFKEIKFFESGYTPPALVSGFTSRSLINAAARFINWELHLTCPSPASRIDFTIYATWYSPSGEYLPIKLYYVCRSRLGTNRFSIPAAAVNVPGCGSADVPCRFDGERESCRVRLFHCN